MTAMTPILIKHHLHQFLHLHHYHHLLLILHLLSHQLHLFLILHISLLLPNVKTFLDPVALKVLSMKPYFVVKPLCYHSNHLLLLHHYLPLSTSASTPDPLLMSPPAASVPLPPLSPANKSGSEDELLLKDSIDDGEHRLS